MGWYDELGNYVTVFSRWYDDEAKEWERYWKLEDAKNANRQNCKHCVHYTNKSMRVCRKTGKLIKLYYNDERCNFYEKIN